MYLCVIRMSLVCTYLLSVCHLYVVLPWILWKTLIQFKQKLWRLQVLLEILVISYAFYFLKESKSKKGRLKRFMVKPHTSDIRMTYKYIWVTSECHDIWMTFEWDTDDMRLERKIRLSFWKLFGNSLSNTWFVKEILACNGCFALFTKIKNWSRINF